MEKERYWSRFADDFEERNNYVVGIKNIEMLMKQLKKEEDLGHVLELACGNGTYTKVICNNSDSIVATDFSDEMVEATTHRLRDLTNVSIEKANCFDLTYANNNFDTVFMANLLHIIPTPDLALKEAKRVVKDGGRIIIVSYTSEGLTEENLMQLGMRYKKTYGNPPETAYRLTRDLATEMVEKQGFSVETCQLIGDDMKAIYLVAKA